MHPHPWSVLVVAITSSVGAQAPAVSVGVIARPHASVAGTFTDACVGQFRGSGYLDHAVVVGGGVWLHSMPRYGGAVEPLPGPALPGATAVTRRFRDHFSLRAGDAQRPRDELWIAHAGGISRWWADGQGHVESLGGAVLAGAKALLSVDVDGDGDLDLVGIAANGRDVVAAFMEDSDLGGATWRTHSGGESVHAIESVLLEAGGVRRVALATASGLGILPEGFDGIPELAVAADARSGSLAAVRCQDGREMIAWVHENAQGNDVLVVHPSPAHPATLGALGVVGIASGDIDTDGDDDLVLSQRLNHCVTLLFNEDPVPVPFGLNALQLRLLPDGDRTPAPDARVRPILADMNGDGDVDILTVAQSDRSVRLIESALGDLGAQIVVAVDGSLTFGNTSVTVDLAMSPGGAWLAGYTHCEVVTWDLTYVEPVVGPGQFVASPMGSIQGLTPLAAPPVVVNLAFEGGLGAFESGGGQLVFWRALEVDPAGIVRRYGPAVGGYFVRPDLMANAASLPGAVPSTLEIKEEDGPGDGIRGVGWVTLEPPPPSGTSGPN